VVKALRRHVPWRVMCSVAGVQSERFKQLIYKKCSWWCNPQRHLKQSQLLWKGSDKALWTEKMYTDVHKEFPNIVCHVWKNCRRLIKRKQWSTNSYQIHRPGGRGGSLAVLMVHIHIVILPTVVQCWCTGWRWGMPIFTNMCQKIGHHSIVPWGMQKRLDWSCPAICVHIVKIW